MKEELKTIIKHLESAHAYLCTDVDIVKVLTAQVILNQSIKQLKKISEVYK